MASGEPEKPHLEEHGAWPSASANSFRENYLLPGGPSSKDLGILLPLLPKRLPYSFVGMHRILK